MKFDGRSWNRDQLDYSYGQKILIKIATRLMPVATRLVVSNRLNTILWRCLGCQVGARSIVRTGTRINVPWKVQIGRDCLIHGDLKSRGGIYIGDGVEMVEDVLISSQSHNVDSELFESVYAPVTIGSNAWLGPRSIVLKGIEVGEGAVIAAGGVLTRNARPWGVYAGVPAVCRKNRAVLARGG